MAFGRSWIVIFLCLVSLQRTFSKLSFFTSSTSPPEISTYKSRWATQSSTRLPKNQPQTECVDSYVALNFTGIGLQRIGDRFVNGPRVIELHLNGNNITDVSCAAFDHLPNLKVLSLNGNNISVDRLLLFDHNGLRKLVLDDNNKYCGDDFIVDRYLRALPSLLELHLRRNQITRFTVSLKTFSPRLTNLYLSGNKIESVDFLDYSPSTLTHLHLDDNSIGNVKTASLMNIVELTVSGNKIEELCASGCSGSSLALKNMPRLKSLNVSRNRISEIAEDTFVDNKDLELLDLSVNKIAKLPSKLFNALLKNLLELRISHNSLTSIPNLCSLQHLRRLDLRGNLISAIFRENFCRHMTHLKTLILADNHITNVDANAFALLHSLHTLDLSSNRMTEIPAGLITNASSTKVILMRNNSIETLDTLRNEKSHLEELHLQENPLLHLKVSWWHAEKLPHLVLHLKDRQWIKQAENKTQEKSEEYCSLKKENTDNVWV
ncbi:PREDICTED: insulin-like growth factor-binding protein complex acid labile subunit [Dufourea novaeangliae]|uniref:Leucine-rich repeat-containing G-protein coupled receptor 6 n=1 Tax=Dufourea novaeangliae TaxID=178035 RepID=A0A154P592_DUFNO|nr:PREDICTED: insulin-like growth factor-binding protein complex acid labile subunit [Dufourea novaeangliae]KZC06348.1 Leucine-rich repeat-containing G-protein coupled receptor 6 [Dufourea novaeangliae]